MKPGLLGTVVLAVYCRRASGVGEASKAEILLSLWCRSVGVGRKGPTGIVWSGSSS